MHLELWSYKMEGGELAPSPVQSYPSVVPSLRSHNAYMHFRDQNQVKSMG